MNNFNNWISYIDNSSNTVTIIEINTVLRFPLQIEHKTGDLAVKQLFFS
jgi:hypothetical protein